VVSTNPSEKYEFVTWDDDIPFSEWKVIKVWLVVSTNPSEKILVSWDDEIPNMMGKSFKIPWFQSAPTSDYYKLLTIKKKTSLTIITPY